uniref:ORF29 n=1 Tax=Malaco herpesvirus 4 TaxID=3031800 RepID=A0AA48SF19_9VIRU|nr:TPA_asm: ORF29 [Malaco herpesvirus 4]
MFFSPTFRNLWVMITGFHGFCFVTGWLVFLVIGYVWCAFRRICSIGWISIVHSERVTECIHSFLNGCQTLGYLAQSFVGILVVHNIGIRVDISPFRATIIYISLYSRRRYTCN